MLRRVILVGMVVALPGCFSYITRLGPTNDSVADAKQGQDCSVLLFGHGGHVHTVAEAMRQGASPHSGASSIARAHSWGLDTSA